MAVQIGAKPLADFDRPIDMLMDCHRRVEHFLELFINVEALYRGKPLDDEALRGLRSAQTYFRTSAPKHTADEESSLFPRLKSQLPAGNPTLDALQKLEADHRWAEELHARIDATVDVWCASPEKLLPINQSHRLRQDLLRLKEHYTEHIRLEEQDVFPLAAQHLSPEYISEIGSEMRNRRQARSHT